MDINFPLLLVLAVFVTGIVYALDVAWLKPRRQQAIQRYREQTTAAAPEVIDKLEKGPVWVEYSRSFFPVLLVVLVLRSFLVEPFQIPSGSMLPTLKVGDFILVNKYHYGIRLPVIGTEVVEFNEPERGDVMVFRYPVDPGINFIKRVVGLPGDHIRYENKTLYINGREMEQTLLARLPAVNPQFKVLEEQLGDVTHRIFNDLQPGQRMKEIVVPAGHYFVMGDNRDHSNDSRYWGFVPEDHIVGKAFAVWMHWESLLSLPSFSDVRLIE